MKPQIIAMHNDNKITYHYVENQTDIDDLVGQVIGKYSTKEYLENASRIQRENKKRIQG
jgi:hypothetical protein